MRYIRRIGVLVWIKSMHILVGIVHLQSWLPSLCRTDCKHHNDWTKWIMCIVTTVHVAASLATNCNTVALNTEACIACIKQPPLNKTLL